MEKYLMVWPKAETVSHINYHYTQLGEVVDYLDKYFPGQMLALDNDVDQRRPEDIIEKENVSKVLVHVNYENAKNAFEMTKKIKEKYNIPIYAYGPITVMLPHLFKNSSFDAIFKDGDYEVSMKEFLRNYDKDDTLEEKKKKNKGSYIINGNSLVPAENGKFINRDFWGTSKQELVPIDKYDRIKKKNRFVLNISKGCPFGCPHCLIQMSEGRIERRRTITNLKEALNQVPEQYKHLKIWAANFTLDKKYVDEFCDVMIKEHPDFTWECSTRIDLIKDKQMLEKMYEAGCRQISLGIESLENKKLIHTKDFDENQIAEAIKNVQDSGIVVKGCVMLGMPNQTKEGMVRTLKFLADRGVIIRPTIYTPYQLVGENVKLEDLSQYNRKTFENTNIEGVTHEQLLELVKNPYIYEEVLNLTPEEVEKMTSEEPIKNRKIKRAFKTLDKIMKVNKDASWDARED